jgi:hypothetical protein
MFCHINLPVTTTEISSYMICQSYWQSENVVHAWWCSGTYKPCRAVRDVLNNTYHDRGTGRRGPTPWPPRSTPDLNPLEFYQWGHLLLAAKRNIALWVPVRVSVTAPASLNGRGGPRWDASRRALNLMEVTLSTCFKRILPANSQKKVSKHMMIWTFFLVVGMWNSCANFVRTFQLHSV